MSILAQYLGVPPALRHPGCLIVTLSLLTFPSEIKSHQLFSRSGRRSRGITSPDQWRQPFRLDNDYQVALRVIQLSPSIEKFTREHASIVWFKRAQSDLEDTDTLHLLHILRKSQVGVVQPDDLSADIVFVHVAALVEIHKLPFLVEHRLRPDVPFCLYGMHETVARARWGFREIYLLGVVTFTPQALLRDTWSVLKTIRLIHDHPLWTCYLIPQIVGLAASLSKPTGGEDHRGSAWAALQSIFAAAVDGTVSIMCAPVDDSCKGTQQWIRDYAYGPQTAWEVEKYCNSTFERAYSSLPTNTWDSIAQDDILEDMERMQRQPAIIDTYRRFVVLDSSLDRGRKTEHGIEWDAINRFDFHDDFVNSQEVTKAEFACM
ncbi:hypothetical protein B0H15DRAFT_952659 [Mycena belliarum]|uniref:Uncharacterized protein n=1 Tax=Mycena belliarum TaxID=1033014 RepID=A0AAD6XRD4_9AGAR|nr:hypothetical protein B0H15DRAFT_952659 [Mycena belliae]